MVAAAEGGRGVQTNKQSKKKRPHRLKKQVKTERMLMQSSDEGHAHEEVKCRPAADQDHQRHVGTRGQPASGSLSPAGSHWF